MKKRIVKVNKAKAKFKRASREANVISIYAMDHSACVTRFLRCLQDGIEKGIGDFIIKWCGELVYPDACVPIAGIIDYYRENADVRFTYDVPVDSYLQRCGFLSPIDQDAQTIMDDISPFDKLYKYSTSAQVAALTQAYIDGLSRLTECNEGVLTGLTWCINEVMDNVLLHSEAGYGLVMAQYHQQKKTVAICVYDILGSGKNKKRSFIAPSEQLLWGCYSCGLVVSG